jgi:prophage maintenance system killer protein
VQAINAVIREGDEWFDEPDDIVRIERVLLSLDGETDPVQASALAMSRLARSQGFSEGNKRTALLVGKWILNRNGVSSDPVRGNYDIGRLLVQASMGSDTETEMLFVLQRGFSALAGRGDPGAPLSRPFSRCGAPTKRGWPCKNTLSCPHHRG